MKSRNKRSIPRQLDEKALFLLLEKARTTTCTVLYMERMLRLRHKEERDTLLDILETAVRQNRLYRTHKGRYGLVTEDTDAQPNTSSVTYEGTLDHVRPLLAYVRCDRLTDDPILQGRQLEGLYHGDRVRFTLLPVRGKEKKAHAHIIKVLTHGQKEWVGHLRAFGADFHFYADSDRLHKQLIVQNKDANGATVEDKVIVQPLPPKNRASYAKVCSVLGLAGTHEVELHSILHEFDVPTRFPEAVLQAAEHFSDQISAEEIKLRRDFRDICCLTIDPDDAKDFDDALSFRVLPGGHFEVGIHIADVSHYVQPGTELDKEAQKRATSVYLVDRTIPMLPEYVSNDLCSLRPNEDRLAVAAVLVLDKEARLQSEWFGRTVIRSQRRFTYDEARDALCAKSSDTSGESAASDGWHKILAQLHTLTQILRAQRFESGAVRLESMEFGFELDEKGAPLRVSPKQHHEAHMLIEELMLLANRRVANYVQKQAKVQDPLFVYRVHDPPEQAKLETLAHFASTFGHVLRFREDNISNQLNALLSKVRGRPEEPLLQQLSIRAMSKATYTTKAVPHFGLGFEHYTHFTSPIRRYPDLLVHRLLLQYLANRPPVDDPPHAALCSHSSDMERKATAAERASIKYKQAEYMLKHIGDTFSGIVSGTMHWGFFVLMKPHYCEGMVRLASLKHDYYTYDEKNLALVGRHSGRCIRLGDTVEVQVLAANPVQRQVELRWISPQGSRPTTNRPLPDKSRRRSTRS